MGEWSGGALGSPLSVTTRAASGYALGEVIQVRTKPNRSILALPAVLGAFSVFGYIDHPLSQPDHFLLFWRRRFHEQAQGWLVSPNQTRVKQQLCRAPVDSYASYRHYAPFHSLEFRDECKSPRKVQDKVQHLVMTQVASGAHQRALTVRLMRSSDGGF